MQWTQERLRYLAEVNKEKKIPRYFSIKKLVETIVEEEVNGIREGIPLSLLSAFDHHIEKRV